VLDLFHIYSHPNVLVTNLPNRFGRISSAIPFPLSVTWISSLLLSNLSTPMALIRKGKANDLTSAK
jgi:hypothetical protein